MVTRLLFLLAVALRGESLYPGIEYTRTGNAHVIVIDLAQPGLRFLVTPPGGSRETVRQTTLDFLREQHAQVAINAHFFEPFPSEDREAFLIGPAASDGSMYSDFESPRQSYAILADAPALNIDAGNHATIVRRGDSSKLYNTIAGSAQIVTNGTISIPRYEEGQLKPGGPNGYSNTDSWYERRAPRSVIGLTRDGAKLVMAVIDRATVAEAAALLQSRFAVWDALNLDGGGSSSLAVESGMLNSPAEVRAVGSNLAVFVR